MAPLTDRDPFVAEDPRIFGAESRPLRFPRPLRRRPAEIGLREVSLGGRRAPDDVQTLGLEPHDPLSEILNLRQADVIHRARMTHLIGRRGSKPRPGAWRPQTGRRRQTRPYSYSQNGPEIEGILDRIQHDIKRPRAGSGQHVNNSTAGS